MSDILQAMPMLLAPTSLLLMMLGVVSGIVVGAIPGLTGTMLIALTVPLTFGMDSLSAIVLLVAMYVGSISGGLISATLMNMPGTPSSVITTFDGYPMARAGRAGRAVGWGIYASFVGGVVSWLFLVGLSVPLARVALTFGSFEYFSMVMMALVLIAAVSQGSMLKGLLSGFLGLLISTVGLDPITASPRLDFGMPNLIAGFHLLPVLIGVFAVSQVAGDITRGPTAVNVQRVPVRDMFMRLSDLRGQWVNLLRSSVIGTWIGILPGVGANVGSVVAYTVAKNSSRHPERFGRGSEEGIVASEAANNATVCGALVPLITLGIPGSIIDAILLGALVIHNVQPGPLLFKSNPEIVYGIITSAFVANLMMFLFMLAFTPWVARVMNIHQRYLLPAVLLFCILGAFAVGNHMFDVWVMLGFGLLGFVMVACGIPLAPFVIGVVLGPVAEETLRAGLMSSAGDWTPLVTRPVSATFLALALLLLAWPYLRVLKAANGRRGAA